MSSPLVEDLDLVLQRTEGLWDNLRQQRVFVTGGTGLFGCWLLESLLWANNKLGMGVSVVVLTRNPAAFQKKAPHLAGNPSLTICTGDVRNFHFPAGSFAYVIHAATEARSTLNSQNALLMTETIVDGTRHTLEFARQCGARAFLLTSSGAVYGRQPHDLALIPETWSGGPDPLAPLSAYDEGKRAAELLCASYAARYGLAVKIARCFTFVGPYLDLGAGFAVGDFIRDGLTAEPVKVSGDGTACRSYLYTADLAVWLWNILLRGESCHPYNVGSDKSLSIADTARTVADCFDPPAKVKIMKKADPGRRPDRYVPSTERARQELGLAQTVEFADAVRRTIRWHRQQGQNQQVLSGGGHEEVV